MNLILMADGAVGNQITSYLVNHYKKDLALVVATKEGFITTVCQRAGVPFRVLGTRFPMPEADLGILAWWPHVIKEPLISYPKHGFINTHPSLLPYNRGKHFNFWAIVERAPFGVSLHRVEAGIDSGAIIAQKKIPYDWTATGETLYSTAQHEMIELFKRTYPKIRKLKFKGRKQPEGRGSFHFASEIDEVSHINLDSAYVARDLLNRLRGRTFDMKPACWFEEDGETYEVTTTIRKVRKDG